ncbi:hypothetical protein Tco_1406075 [Tanacetum coccineum]
MKLMKETSYELLKDTEKKQLGKNEEAKMTIYNALPRKEYQRVFMCKTAKEHESREKVFHALPLKWRDKVTTIEEAKYLATLPLDELISNLKEQTSDDSDSQGGSDKDTDEEAEAFNLLARNFSKFFHKGGESSKLKGACYNCDMEDHFTSECRKPNENKAFMGGAWSDSEDGDEQPNDATCLMAIDSQEVVSKPSSSNYDMNYIDLQKENEELLNGVIGERVRVMSMGSLPCVRGGREEDGDLSLEAMEDEEVPLVNGVFEGAFDALRDEWWCVEVEALMGAIEVMEVDDK